MPRLDDKTSNRWKTVRVFISSTFSEINAECYNLATVAFPELRKRVEQLGLEYFDVYLRYSVRAKNANEKTIQNQKGATDAC